MEDDRVAILEAQLAQAKLIAEEADKKYEEVESHFIIFLWLGSASRSPSWGLLEWSCRDIRDNDHLFSIFRSFRNTRHPERWTVLWADLKYTDPLNT